MRALFAILLLVILVTIVVLLAINAKAETRDIGPEGSAVRMATTTPAPRIIHLKCSMEGCVIVEGSAVEPPVASEARR